jgi:AraC family transcriptional activator of pobA
MQRAYKNIPTLTIENKIRNGLSVKIIDERARNHPEIFKPHRDDHYMIILALSGSYKMMLDFDRIRSEGPSVLLIHPGQVHQLLEMESPDGIAIDFEPVFMPMYLENLFDIYQRETPIIAMISQFDMVKKLTDLLYISLYDKATYSDDFVSSLLMSFLMLVKDMFGFGSRQPIADTKAKSISNEFKALVKHQFRDWKRPAQYAEALFISPGYLNEVTNQTTGKSVSAYIQQISVLEAKRLLFFTESDIKSISYQVGYEDPGYFSRLFKKITGLTPLDFRRQIHDPSYKNKEQAYS